MSLAVKSVLHVHIPTTNSTFLIIATCQVKKKMPFFWKLHLLKVLNSTSSYIQVRRFPVDIDWCFVVRGESPGCRLFSTASHWLIYWPCLIYEIDLYKSIYCTILYGRSLDLKLQYLIRVFYQEEQNSVWE